MVSIINLPMEIQERVLNHLPLCDLVRFLATCRSYQAIFRPDQMNWLLQNFFRQADGKMGDTAPIEEAVRQCGFVLRCHVYLILLRNFGLRHELKTLNVAKIPLASIFHAGILKKYFTKYGPGKRVNWLLQNGASFHSIPNGGINGLLEDVIRRPGRYQNRQAKIKFLIAHGASFDHLPTDNETLIEQLLQAYRVTLRRPYRYLPKKYFLFLLHNAHPLTSCPPSLAANIRATYLRSYRHEDLRTYLRFVPDAYGVVIKAGMERALCEQDLDPLLRTCLGRWYYERVHPMYPKCEILHTPTVNTMVQQGLLTHAARTNDHIAVTRLLSLCDSLDPLYTDFEGNTPMRVAIEAQSWDAVEILIGHSAYRGCLQDDCRDALAVACSAGDLEAAQMLLNWGARPDDGCHEGRTPLQIACLYQRDDMVELLLQYGAKPNISFMLCAHGSTFSPLYWLVCSWYRNPDDENVNPARQVKIIERLATSGADFNFGEDLLLSAVLNRRAPEVIEALLTHGARTRLPRSTFCGPDQCGISTFEDRPLWEREVVHGKTPLHLACLDGNIPIIELFLQYTASWIVNHREAHRRGYTALELAAFRLNQSIEMALVKLVYDFHDKEGEPPDPEPYYFPPSVEDCVRTIQLLLSVGATSTGVHGKKFPIRFDPLEKAHWLQVPGMDEWGVADGFAHLIGIIRAAGAQTILHLYDRTFGQTHCQVCHGLRCGVIDPNWRKPSPCTSAIFLDGRLATY